jgi:hypothetical protein
MQTARRHLHCAWTAICLFACVCESQAGDTPFHKPQLPYGINMEIPSEWIGYSAEKMAQLMKAVEEAKNPGGPGTNAYGLKAVFFIRQPRKNSDASLILAAGIGTNWLSQQQVKALTPEDLQTLDGQIKTGMERTCKNIGVRITEWVPTRTTEINGRTFLQTTYKRTSPKFPDDTYVEIYQMFDKTRCVNLSLEYLISDKAIWDPICRRSLNSLRIESPPVRAHEREAM